MVSSVSCIQRVAGSNPTLAATYVRTLWDMVAPWLSVGHGGALVESIAFNRRVVGSTPALAAM